MQIDRDEHSLSAYPSMFIASDEHYMDPDICSHTNIPSLPRTPGQSRKPLALLGGYRQGTSSLGTKMAISPDGERIAASVWDHIYIWSLSPKLLAEGELNLYFPPR